MRAPIAPALIVLLASGPGPATAQPANEALQCRETLERLDRELSVLAERIGLPRPGPENERESPESPERVLSELDEMATLRDPLRCMSRLGGRN